MLDWLTLLTRFRIISTMLIRKSLKRLTHVQGTLSRLEIELKKGDYPVQEITIPKETSVTFYSKDKVRLLFIGKRNRPLFLLQEKCELVLKEKLEILLQHQQCARGNEVND